ncbi:hypothetical protein MARA_01460 (plasmid) [Mycolicibacterium arabiense]|uniref:Uncharacterized protein n=1 Tax=Mycolicibacterium arabiense TaxID=1286181 RepID=A0A7I7RRN8_9MYCO|nr:hypothetical protein MARA_01460 [Mycolicibacterium arabiense]
MTETVVAGESSQIPDDEAAAGAVDVPCVREDARARKPLRQAATRGRATITTRPGMEVPATATKPGPRPS